MPAKQKITTTRTRTKTRASTPSKSGTKRQKRCPNCGKFMK